MPIAHAIDS